MNRLRVAFMGTPEFAVAPLKELINRNDLAELVGVFSQPDNKRDRGKMVKPTPVKEVALSNGLNLLQPTNINSDEAYDALKELKPDLIVVVAYGQILKSRIYDLPKHKSINIHASLLPRWRGASPINHSLLHGDAQSGISIQYVSKGVDKGDIILQKSVNIDINEDYSSLHDRLSVLGSKALIEALRMILNDSVEPMPQDNSLATYAPLMSKELGSIDWTKSAKEIHNQVRALVPWPGAYFDYWGTNIKVWRTSFSESISPLPAGKILVDSSSVRVACGEGLLHLLELQRPNGKRLTIQEFIKGFKFEKDLVTKEG